MISFGVDGEVSQSGCGEGQTLERELHDICVSKFNCKFFEMSHLEWLIWQPKIIIILE